MLLYDFGYTVEGGLTARAVDPLTCLRSSTRRWWNGTGRFLQAAIEFNLHGGSFFGNDKVFGQTKQSHNNFMAYWLAFQLSLKLRCFDLALICRHEV